MSMDRYKLFLKGRTTIGYSSFFSPKGDMSKMSESCDGECSKTHSKPIRLLTRQFVFQIVTLNFVIFWFPWDGTFRCVDRRKNNGTQQTVNQNHHLLLQSSLFVCLQRLILKDWLEDVILRLVIDALLFYVFYLVFGSVSHYQKFRPVCQYRRCYNGWSPGSFS